MKNLKSITIIALVFIANITFARQDSNINFAKDLNAFTNSYLQLKDSFVEADENKITAIASRMIEDVLIVNMEGLNSSDMEVWHNYMFEIKANLGKILVAENIKTKREAFAKLSETMIEVLKKYDAGQKLYVIKCPMFEGGSYWISNSKTIENPFYGDDMLTCGSVVNELK